MPPQGRGASAAPGGIPQGGGVRRGGDDAAVGKLRGKSEACADPGGRVDQDPVEGLAGSARSAPSAAAPRERPARAPGPSAGTGPAGAGCSAASDSLQKPCVTSVNATAGCSAMPERDVEIPPGRCRHRCTRRACPRAARQAAIPARASFFPVPPLPEMTETVTPMCMPPPLEFSSCSIADSQHNFNKDFCRNHVFPYASLYFPAWPRFFARA